MVVLLLLHWDLRRARGRRLLASLKMRRHAKSAASTTDTKLKESSSAGAAGAPVGFPEKAVAGGEEAVGQGDGGAGGGSGWEDTGSTNPTTPIVEGGTQDAMPGRAPGAVTVSSEPSPLLLQPQQQNSLRQHAREQQEGSPQQQQHVSGVGEGEVNRSGSRGKRARMTFSRRGSGVLLADVARRVSRSFSLLSRGRSNAEQPNDDAGAKKLGSGGVSIGPAADEPAADTKKKVRSVNNQNSSTPSGPTPDEATATHNTDGTVDADVTPAGVAAGRDCTVKTRMSLLKRGALSSSFGKGSAAARAGGAGGDRASSGQQQEGHSGPSSTGGHQHGVAPQEEGSSKRQAAITPERGQGTKSNSSNNVAATTAGSYTRGADTAAQLSGGVGRHQSRRDSSVAGGSSTAEKAGTGGGTANVSHETVASSHSRRKFHIPHPHLPGHFRHKHQQELQSGGPSMSESKAAHRPQTQHAGEGNSVTGGEEGGGLVTGASGLTATGAGGASARGAASAAVPPHHQSHLPLLHLGNFLHHHKGTTTAAAADQPTQQSQQQTQQPHHLLPHLHLLHGGPAAAEPSVAPDSGEDSMELLAQLHAAHERARDIVERSRTQREQLLQRAREEVEEEALAMRREAALIFEAKQERSDEQTEEACRAAAAAGDDVVRVDPTALLQASQLCVAETLKVGVHLPEDFRKRLSVIHQHPPTFFRKSCADQYPSTRGLKDPAVLKAALHHAYRHGYQSSDRQYGDVSYVVDEGASSAYRGAGLDLLGGATGASSVSDANREAYAAILGERGAWTEQDDEFRLDLRDDAVPGGENGQRQTLLESILSWFLQHSTCNTGDASSNGTNVAAGGRKEDERSHERRAPSMCQCWPLVSTDSS